MGNLGWRTYLIFTVFNFSFLPFIYFFHPETSGRRLEEIDAIFYKTSPIVAGTQWAKRGDFESNELEVGLGWFRCKERGIGLRRRASGKDSMRTIGSFVRPNKKGKDRRARNLELI